MNVRFIETLEGLRLPVDGTLRRDHVRVPEDSNTIFPAGDRAAPNRRYNPKWCAVPSGLLSRFGWGVHHVGGPFVKLAKAQKGAELYHCRGTSTAWKGKRFDLPQSLTPDPDLATFWQTRFPAP